MLPLAIINSAKQVPRTFTMRITMTFARSTWLLLRAAPIIAKIQIGGVGTTVSGYTYVNVKKNQYKYNEHNFRVSSTTDNNKAVPSTTKRNLEPKCLISYKN